MAPMMMKKAGRPAGRSSTPAASANTKRVQSMGAGGGLNKLPVVGCGFALGQKAVNKFPGSGVVFNVVGQLHNGVGSIPIIGHIYGALFHILCHVYSTTLHISHVILAEIVFLLNLFIFNPIGMLGNKLAPYTPAPVRNFCQKHGAAKITCGLLLLVGLIEYTKIVALPGVVAPHVRKYIVPHIEMVHTKFNELIGQVKGLTQPKAKSGFR